MTRAALALWLLAVFPALSAAQTVLPPALPLPIKEPARCLYQDYVGFVWLCTDRGFVRFDGREEVTFATDTPDLRAILRASRGGQYWVGAASGLYQMRSKDAVPGTVRLERVVTEHQVAAVNALVEFSGGEIGLATDDGALQLADGKVTEIPLGLPEDRAARVVHVLLQTDGATAVLAGTTSGLYLRSRRQGTRRFTTDDGLPDNDVKALAATPGGRIWIGTSQGLAYVERKDLQSPRPVRMFSDAEVLRNADVRALRVVDSTLWVGASTGLVAISTFPSRSPEARLVAYAAVRMFSHGYATDLLVATDDDIRFVPTGPSRGRTVIIGITVDGRSQPIPFEGSTDTRLVLPRRSRLVEIRFVQPRREMLPFGRSGSYLLRTGVVGGRERTFSDMPEPWTMFRTSHDGQIHGGIYATLPRVYVPHSPRLRRGDVGPVVLRRSQQDGPPSAFSAKHIVTADVNGWLRLPEEAERRIIIEHPAQTLAAGLHRVAVYAGDSASVEFVVPQPLWVRWWFIGPIGLTAGVGAFVVRRTRVRRRQELAGLRRQIASDLHDSVGARMSRIALLSDVARQNSTSDLPLVSHSLDAIGEDARALVDEMNDAVWFIDNQAAELHELIVRVRTVAAALFDHDATRWDIDADGAVSRISISAVQRRDLFLMIKEALTNIRRHARAARVSVRITRPNGMLNIEIEDDGIGVANGSRSGTGGNGLRNIDRRAAELGGTLTVSSRPDVEGTRLTLLVPIH